MTENYGFPVNAGSANQILRVSADGNLVFETLSAIDGATIGATTASIGKFTSLESSTTLAANVVTAAVLTASNLMTENYGFPVSSGTDGQVLQLANGNLVFSTISTSLSIPWIIQQ